MKSLNEYINEKHWPHTMLAEGKDPKQTLFVKKMANGSWEVHIVTASELPEFIAENEIPHSYNLKPMESKTVLGCGPNKEDTWVICKI